MNYIVWNETNYGLGYEFFGVYKTRQKAEKVLAKILKERYGKTEIDDDVLAQEAEDGDNYLITEVENM